MRESAESMGAKKVADLTHRTIEASFIARMGVTAKTKAAREKSLIVRFMQEFTYHGQSTEKRLKEEPAVAPDRILELGMACQVIPLSGA